VEGERQRGSLPSSPVETAGAVRAFREAGVPFQPRDTVTFARLAFTGLELVPPGVVPGGSGATSAAFSPDGTILAVNDSGGSTNFWDIATGHWIAALPPGPCRGGAAQVLFSPDGKTLAVIGAGNGGTTCLWNVAARQETATLTHPADSAGDLGDPVGAAFGPGGTTLAVADDWFGGYIWDIATRRIVATLDDPVSGPNTGGWGLTSLAPSANGRLAVGDGSSATCVWDMATRQTTACFTLPINVLALNPSYYCQQCDQGGSILPGGPGPLTVTVGLSPDGKTLAAAAEGGNGTEVWDVATKHLIATVNGPGGSNNTEEPGPITFSPDGSLMAVVNTNNSGVTYLWRVSELEPSG